MVSDINDNGLDATQVHQVANWQALSVRYSYNGVEWKIFRFAFNHADS